MVDVPSMRLTNSARDCILFELHWQLADVLAMIKALKRSNFYKSMTTNLNYKVWQDVYHTEWKGVAVYVKFQQQAGAAFYFVISCKEL